MAFIIALLLSTVICTGFCCKTSCPGSCMKYLTEKLQEQERNLIETFTEKMKIHDDTVRSLIDIQRTPTVVFNVRDVASKDVVKGEILQFINPIVNIGGGYDENTGNFTAPYNGTYQFNAQVCTRYNYRTYVLMKAAGKIIGALAQRGAEYGTCTYLGGVIVLNKGDKCWVEGAWTALESLAENVHRLNTFSGFLIHTGTG